MSIKSYYDSLSSKSDVSRETLFNDGEISSLFIRSHNYISEYERLSSVSPNDFSEFIRSQSVVDLQRSLLFCANSHYVSAFVFLRMYFEKYLSYILLCSSEQEYRLWRCGLKDISWKEITDENKGVFSANFNKAFESGLLNERNQFLGIAKAVYRECSEYVHGNHDAINSITPEIAFDESLCQNYLARLDSMHEVCIFAWCVRFLGIENVNSDSASDVILDRLGHLAVVRAHFERGQ